MRARRSIRPVFGILLAPLLAIAFNAARGSDRPADQVRDPGCYGRIPSADSNHFHRDGPHVFWESDRQARVVYLIHDPARDTSEVVERMLTVDKRPFALEGFAGDRRTLLLGIADPGPAKEARPESICTAGDLHGEYEDAVRLLRGCGVTDERNNWAFGRGHLVFCGDILDRGPGVTDCLWWIRELQRQARLAGGDVHQVLGNHDRYGLNGSDHDVACTTLFLCRTLGVPYADLYGPRTELGQWLRGLPSVLQLGDLLFTHGGLSPEVARSGLSLDQINATVRRCVETGTCSGAAWPRCLRSR
jgi:hypothetical protein